MGGRHYGAHDLAFRFSWFTQLKLLVEVWIKKFNVENAAQINRGIAKLESRTLSEW